MASKFRRRINNRYKDDNNMRHDNHKRHKVMLYKWVMGCLRFEELFFDTLEEAIEFLEEEIECYHSFKVYDHDGELVHHGHSHRRDDDECDPYA